MRVDSRRSYRSLCATVVACAFVASQLVGRSSVSNAQTTRPECPVDQGVAEFVSAKSNEQLARGVFVVHVYGSGANTATRAQRRANVALYGVPTPGAVVEAWKPAGVILIQRNAQDAGRPQLASGNIVSATQLRRFTDDLRRDGGDPKLVVGVDQEGGRVNRLKGIYGSVPSAAMFGATEKTTQIVFDEMATNLQKAGINMDFAPVADVVFADTARTGVIGDRSFGSDPAVVASRVSIAVATLQQRGIASVAKHWPGHGSTFVDSHVETPVLDYARDDVAQRNLRPFVTASEEGVAAIMVGHLAVPAWDPTRRPATISKPILTRLRSEFCGVIVTDSLWMGGVRRHGTDDAIVRYAVDAGVDLLLMPVNLRSSIAALADEATRDPSFRARLVEANRRVETLRRRFVSR